MLVISYILLYLTPYYTLIIDQKVTQYDENIVFKANNILTLPTFDHLHSDQILCCLGEWYTRITMTDHCHN